MKITKEYISTSPFDATNVSNEFEESKHEEARRYIDAMKKAQEKINDFDASGMYEQDNSFESHKAATKTLRHLGYSYNGGEYWKPPIGKQDKPQEWDGEGWPPIGADCEIQTTGDYFEARIDYIDWIHCIFTSKKRNATTTYRKIKELKFRPIKPEPTEAEKEAKEREEIIKEWWHSPLRKERFHIIDDPKKFGEFYDWLKSTDRLKGGDDHE